MEQDLSSTEAKRKPGGVLRGMLSHLLVFILGILAGGYGMKALRDAFRPEIGDITLTSSGGPGELPSPKPLPPVATDLVKSMWWAASSDFTGHTWSMDMKILGDKIKTETHYIGSGVPENDELFKAIKKEYDSKKEPGEEILCIRSIVYRGAVDAPGIALDPSMQMEEPIKPEDLMYFSRYIPPILLLPTDSPGTETLDFELATKARVLSVRMVINNGKPRLESVTDRSI